jgi:hypothetical protein
MKMKLKMILCGFAATMMFVQPGVAEDEDTPLAQQMDTMNSAYKAMRREKDPVKGAELALEAQNAMFKAIIEIPELVKAMPDGPDKAKASAEFRKMMGSLISTLASMELAFLDGDLAKVKELVGTLRESKKEGHDKFMEDD